MPSPGTTLASRGPKDLRRLSRKFGLPQRIRTDNGAPFVYKPSPRPLPRRIPQIEYPAHFEVRYVSTNSGIRWNSSWLCVSSALARQYVGLEEVDNGVWDVCFGPLKLGCLHERTLRIEDALGRQYRKKVSPMYPD